MISANINNIKASFLKTDKRIPAAHGCLASVFRYFGHDFPLYETHNSILAGKLKLSLHGLIGIAQSKDFMAEGYEGDINFLKEFYMPVILPVEKKTGYDHCFVLYGWCNNKFVIGDPHWSIIEYRKDELEALWTSKSFLLVRPPG